MHVARPTSYTIHRQSLVTCGYIRVTAYFNGCSSALHAEMNRLLCKGMMTNGASTCDRVQLRECRNAQDRE